MKTYYFDNSATTKTDERVVREMIPYLTEEYGNPSSIYKIGRESKRAIEEARKRVAKVFNCEPSEIFFTSGGSESDNTIIRGIAYENKEKGKHIITSKIEHPAVLETCKQLEKEGFEVTYIGIDKKGILNLRELESAIKPTTTLITVMFANNEIGTLQPIEEIGLIAKKHNIIFHTDAVQAVGNVNIDVKKMNIDSLSLSAHKFYGPKGIGAFYLKKDIKFKKFINGGHQEKNKRAGTENVAGIVGLGKAIEFAAQEMDEHIEKTKQLRDYYIKQVSEKIPNITINGDLEKRLPGNCNISFKFVDGEALLFNLDQKGICASSGSACTSGLSEPSHVLVALGVPGEIARGSLRITLGKYNTREEVDYLINNLVEVVEKIRKMSHVI